MHRSIRFLSICIGIAASFSTFQQAYGASCAALFALDRQSREFQGTRSEAVRSVSVSRGELESRGYRSLEFLEEIGSWTWFSDFIVPALLERTHGDLRESDIFIKLDSRGVIEDAQIAYPSRTRRSTDGNPYNPLDISGRRADVLSLGVILYRIFTGDFPVAEGELVVFRSRMAGLLVASRFLGFSYTPILRIDPDVPRELVEIVDRALKKRTYSLDEMGADLRAYERLEEGKGPLTMKREEMILGAGYRTLESLIREGETPSLDWLLENLIPILERRSHGDLRDCDVYIRLTPGAGADLQVRYPIETRAAGSPQFTYNNPFGLERGSQADAFAMGVLFYQILAGRVPFREQELAPLRPRLAEAREGSRYSMLRPDPIEGYNLDAPGPWVYLVNLALTQRNVDLRWVEEEYQQHILASEE